MLSSLTSMMPYRPLSRLCWLTWITFLFLKIRHTMGSPCMVKDGSSIFLTIPESFPPGRVFKTLDMIEGDASPKGNINLRLKEPNPYFALDGVSKNLLLLHQIDREFLESKSPTKSVQKLTVVCEYLDHDTWRRIDIPIQIVVTDVNDFTPKFIGTPYRVTVSELTPVGSIIYKNIRAEDGDATNNLVDYSIVPGPYSSYVRFDDSLSGNLVLATALDYEALRAFNVTVAARDQGNPPLTATTNVEITVQDGDDYSPEFAYPSYTATLPREAPRGYVLKIRPESIRAVDKDAGISTPIEYRIVEGANFFDINKKTGQVFVNGTVASGGLYVLTVRASQVDNPSKFTLATLRITAERPNHNPPRFVQKEYAQKVPENIPVGSTVMSVRATDPDPDSTLAYSLLSAELVPHFNLSISGDLMIARPLDYEVSRQYVMFVGVTDGEFTDQARVIIDILNINDHDPEFSQAEYSFDVGADARVDGAILGKLQVTDRDGDNVTLSLLNYQE
ncbi:hypothetical protein RvY_03198-2 [Ramazzottius varieornatus]|uniref:Cadherin domain-containing protein n=1 Tax=Ramazzottius varieornatus TaxID=947166 RepID=A0A1D1UM82_RAMVA|nr:hypothetical protein RvY_03198-2 [Ramazzottius varieornatus]